MPDGYVARPYITSFDREKKEPLAAIQDIMLQKRRAEDYFYPDRERLVRNMRMYWATDYAQWPQYIVDRLRSQGRNAPSYNVTGNKVEALGGLLLKNQFDAKFEPKTGEVNSLTLRLQDMYLSDKELMDWDSSYKDFLINFLVTFGVEQMVVSDRHSPLGNIGFESVNPIMWMPDPNWKTPYPRDMRHCFKFGYLSAKEILDIFPDKRDELNQDLKLEDKYGEEYGEWRSPHSYLYKDLEGKWGSKHLVVEYHYLEPRRRTVEFNKREGVLFPEGDDVSKRQYALGRPGGPLMPHEIMFIEQKKKVYRIQTAIPTLSDQFFFEDREHEIQIDRLPFFPAGVGRFNGQYRGIVDDLYDVQQNINKNEMDMTDIRQRAAKGAFFLDPEIVDQDPTEQEKIEAEWNNPGFRMWTKPGALSDTNARYIVEVPQTNIPGDLVQNTDRMWNLADRLSKQPAAADARTESGSESGRLFTAKYEAGLVAQGVMNKNLELHLNDKAEAYMLQSRITYAGVERSFPMAGGKGAFKVNEFVEADGHIAIRNDISKLPRHQVIITQNPKGTTISAHNRVLNAEMMKTLGSNQGLLQVALMERIFDSLEVSEEEKEENRRMMEILKLRETMMVVNDIRTLEMNMKQTEKMLSQITGQPPTPLNMGGVETSKSPAVVPDQFTPSVEGNTSTMIAPMGTPQQTNEDISKEVAELFSAG